MRVLITGGTGLLGSALCYTASNDIDGVPLNSKSCDLKDYEASKKVISHLHSIAPFQAIIHCAARVGGLFRNLREPVQMLNDNLQINTNVLAIANELNINRVVCVLSTCIFPDKIDYPIKPDQLHDGKPHHSNEGYAYAKRMLEVACRA